MTVENLGCIHTEIYFATIDALSVYQLRLECLLYWEICNLLITNFILYCTGQPRRPTYPCYTSTQLRMPLWLSLWYTCSSPLLEITHPDLLNRPNSWGTRWHNPPWIMSSPYTALGYSMVPRYRQFTQPLLWLEETQPQFYPEQPVPSC